MKNISIIGVAALAAISLSGCGGGGGGSSSDPREAEVGQVDEITNAQARARFNALNVGFDNVQDYGGSTSNLPDSGSASYQGSLGFDLYGAVPGIERDAAGNLEPDGSMVGDLNLNVSFEGDLPVDGTVTNLLYADINDVLSADVGDLTVSGRVFETTTLGAVIRADAVGDTVIVRPDGTQLVAMDLDISAQFGFSDAGPQSGAPDIIRGVVVGNVDNGNIGGTGDLDLRIPNGRFAVEVPGTGLLALPPLP